MVQDFNDLRFFAAVVTHGGFSAAARALGLPKSRISRRISLLEEQLGVRLLERNTRKVSLTEVGDEVYQHARAAMIEAEAVEEVALRRRAEPRGLVRLSVPLGLQQAIAGPLPAFLARYPLLKVQCVIANRRVDLVEDGFDIAVRVRERLDTDPMLQMRRIGISRRILVASPAIAALLPPDATPDHLSHIPLLDHQEGRAGPTTWSLTGPDNASHSIIVDPRFATGSFDLLLACARAGVGATLVPEPSCLDDLEAGTLVRVLPAWSGIDGIVHLVFTSRRGMLPGVRAVIEFAAEALKPAVIA